MRNLLRHFMFTAIGVVLMATATIAFIFGGEFILWGILLIVALVGCWWIGFAFFGDHI